VASGASAVSLPTTSTTAHAGGSLAFRARRIAPRAGWSAINLGEVWERRELLFFLALRELKVRYRQAALGIGWAVLQPLLTMVVFTFIFHRVAGIQVGGTPYAVFSLTGLLPWILFQTALTRSSESLVNNAGVLGKVYFPRLLIPFATLGSALLDFLISFVILLLMMAAYGVPFTWRLALVPLFMVYASLAALSIGLWLTSLHVRYRDVGQLLPFLVRIGMFISPVAYPLDVLAAKTPAAMRWLILGNPMASVLEGFRWTVLGGPAPDLQLFAVSACAVVLLLVGGLFVFCRVERTLADVI
jgi:lipopolysaccharide transport system permease protein